MVKLRLKRMGKIDTPFYRIVVLDSRKKRDGAYIESLGYYDPKTDPLTLKVDTDKAIQWLQKGAQPSDTVRSLLRKAGVLEKWHNMKIEANEGKEKETKVKKTTAKKTTVKKTEKKEAKPVVEKAEEKPAVKTEKKETKPTTKKTKEKPAVKVEKKEATKEKDTEEK
jgi:small subunit ribosomal protein S16